MGLQEQSLNTMIAGVAGGKDVHRQYGALCYRIKKGQVQVLLVTSRTRRRWIIPKGWPMKGLKPWATARVEAWEEAGVRGKASDRCLGVFTYRKIGDGGKPDRFCAVAVYTIRVKSLAKAYPEASERRRRWMTPRQAARKVQEPGLRTLLKSFDPAKI